MSEAESEWFVTESTTNAVVVWALVAIVTATAVAAFFRVGLVDVVLASAVVVVEEHVDGVSLTPTFTFVCLLLFTMAFGVVWELLEFAIGEAARLFGTAAVLTQFGLDDTVLDLMYDTAGGLVVALFGTAYLTGLSEQLATRLDGRSTKR